MMLKRMLKTMLICVFACLSITVTALEYNDVKKDDWYYDSVDYVSKKGIMNGIGNNIFSPDTDITRAMAVTMLYRFAGQPKTTGKNEFSDVDKDSYYCNAVVWAAENNIVNGYDEKTFAPDDKITREQLCTVIYRYFDSLKLDITEKADLSAFDDANVISTYAKQAVAWNVAEGIVTGVTHSKISPLSYTTRAQSATVLMRLDKLILSIEEESDTTPDDKDITSEIPSKPADTEKNNSVQLVGKTVKAVLGQSNVELVISIKNNPGIPGMMFKVGFDTKALTLTQVKKGEALDVEGISFIHSSGKLTSGISFIWFGAEIKEDSIRDGDVLTLVFDVSHDAKAGEYDVIISCEDGDVVDNDAKTVDVDVINGKILVE